MSLVDSLPDERHLALTAPARHKAFHQRIAEMAEALQREKEFLASMLPPMPVEVPSVTEDVLVKVLQATLDPPPPPPVKRLWFKLISDGPRQLSMTEIKKVTCGYFGQSVRHIESDMRYGPLIIPRQVGMYLCKELTPNSLPAIGRAFGNRDHTTVLHAIRKIYRLFLADDPVVIPALASIRADLEIQT